ncbi:NUDIX domain-containing protein [Streptomyces goshikiensis]
MAITDSDIAGVLAAYLERFPQGAGQLTGPLRLLTEGQGLACRRTFPMHVTAGALLVRDGGEVLLVEHRAYGITLQPGGHLEAADTTLLGAALRELSEETGIDPELVVRGPTRRSACSNGYQAAPVTSDSWMRPTSAAAVAKA